MSAVARRCSVVPGEETLGQAIVKWAVCMEFEMPVNVGPLAEDFDGKCGRWASEKPKTAECNPDRAEGPGSLRQGHR
jgi:hypothetical protein